MSIYNNGSVSIATGSTGSHKLAVGGSIGAREIKVEVGNWSDFVFYEDYKLPTLEEVETHIKENGHLKDIPSAKEVEQNGINLGEMNAKLLQKIEELMLYTIEQEKKLKIQKEVFQKQQIKIEKLEFLVKKVLQNKTNHNGL
jgi:translation elongation factor EF-G